MDDATIRHEVVSVVKRGPHDCLATCSCGRQKLGTTLAKAEARLKRHATERNRELCPTPTFSAYETQEEAERAMRDTWKIQHGERAARRVYRCADGCGMWHLTKKPVRGGRGR